MLLFATSIVISSLATTVSPTYSSWQLGERYRRINTVQIVEVELAEICFFQALWSMFNNKKAPTCSSIWDYEPEQTDGDYKWCVEKSGKPIPYTRDNAESFPYNCKKTRGCPEGLVREKTGRCDATCAGAAGQVGFQTKFYCRNECICPRGRYRDENGACVWLRDCTEASCEPPMQFTECASKCPFTCATQRHICDYSCDPNNKCACPDGMVFISKINGTCINKEDCPKCKYGAIPTDCSPPCQETCMDGDDGDSCNEGDIQCTEGVHCMCPPHMIQVDRNLPIRCVRPVDCPAECEYPLISKRCTKPCQPTCDDPDPVCEGKCASTFVCGCPDGYIRKSATDRTCVRHEECVTTKLDCKYPATPTKCDNKCPRTCEPERFMCLRLCESEYVCSCPEGFLLEKVDGNTCVREGDCPNRCEEPKVFESCASMCPPTCQDPNPSSCRRGCRKELCVCPQGMVQPDKDTLTCMKPSECPVICDAPKVVKDCKSPCPATCDEPDPVCDGECEPEKVCGCPNGMVQRSREDTTCLELSECAGCQLPAYPVECTSECPENCENPRLGSIFGEGCTRDCRSKYSCACPDGYILKSMNGKECIRKDECPSSCEYPLVYASCASLCQPTCDNPKPASCRRACSSQLCVCSPGMVQIDEDTLTCVTLDQCPKCSSPKVFDACPSKCQPTCDNQNPGTGADCESGCREDKCVCQPGMVYLNSSSSVCVKPSRCPKTCVFPEVSSSCRSTCEATCENALTIDNLNCPIECGTEQCVCANGYVRRSSSDSTCVALGSCPSLVTEPISQGPCKAPKVYAECASKCPPTCAIPNPLACTRGCDWSVECVCPDGYVQRDDKNRTCILPEDCPKCEWPKVYVECASKCQPTCDQPTPTLCIEGCDPQSNCVCPPGMVKPTADDDTCILASKCPGSCDFPKMATQCASKCPPTCDDPAPTCGGGCDEDVKCECQKGLLQISATDSTCVIPQQCPKYSGDCPSGKVSTRCASSCPATCDEPNPGHCAQDCRPDLNCECAPGMVQRSRANDTCILPIEC